VEIGAVVGNQKFVVALHAARWYAPTAGPAT
jgi:hypothetical protein